MQRLALVMALLAAGCGDGKKVGVGAGGNGGNAGAGGDGGGGSGSGSAGSECPGAAVMDTAACPEDGYPWRCTVNLGSGPVRACYTSQIDCTTAVDCDGNGKADQACICGSLLLECPGSREMGKCGRPGVDVYCRRGPSVGCNPDKPFFCAATGTCFAGDGHSVDCATVTDCDGDGIRETACPCGQVADCTVESKCRTP